MGSSAGQGWGWGDPYRWRVGWDSWFWNVNTDPNYGVWNNEINNEAVNIAGILDSGNAQLAAQQLSNDLFEMRGDMYAQDQLLANTAEHPGIGAMLELNNWDPARGTWDDVEIQPASNDPEPNIPIQVYNGYGDGYVQPVLDINLNFNDDQN